MNSQKSILSVACVLSFSVVVCASAAQDGNDVTATSRTQILPRPHAVDNRAELKPSVGILAGYSTLNGGSFSNNGAAILDVGFQPYVPFGLSAQFQYSPGNVGSGAAQRDLNTTNVLAKGTYNFGGYVPVLRNAYVGLKSGLTIYTGDIDTSTHYSLGPVIGFDIPIDQKKTMTLGAEGTYLGVLGENSPDQVSALGAVKYWF
ncbi:MAG: hypothetical protein H7301_10510 [Cryobacterium sp.]|nr:hypothetical protein [Oligoflexia bacterium]